MTTDSRMSVDRASKLRAANLRTGAILFTIAVVFFGGVIASHYLGSATAAIAVIGLAVLLFLVVAIGRHLIR